MLERKTSLVFDSKAQKQKRDDADQRAYRERQVSEYAEKHKLQALFDVLSAAAALDGPNATEADAAKKIYACLIERRSLRAAQRERLHFRESLAVDVGDNLSVRAQIPTTFGGGIGGGDVLLSIRRVTGPKFVLNDTFGISWEQFAEWESVLLTLAPFSEPLTQSVPGQLYAVIKADDRATAFLAPSKECKAIIEDLVNRTMELRQSVRRVEVFQPL